MAETFKEQQVEALFNPQTPDDQVVVHVLKALDLVVETHKGDVHYSSTVGFLGGIATALSRSGDTTFDGELMDKHIRSELDRFMPPETGNEG